MRAINHALTGALIGLTVSEPVIAIPVAVTSHYLCDMIPHYGADLPQTKELRSKVFRNLIYLDAVLCFGLVLILALIRPRQWLLAAVCAFAAASPDLLDINHYLSTIRHKPWHGNAYFRFAKNIQWFERPIGAVVDVAWFGAATVLLLPFLR